MASTKTIGMVAVAMAGIVSFAAVADCRDDWVCVDAVDQGQYDGVTKSDMPQGGHLVVMNTPTVTQKLSGVQFSRFGQMGKAWRHVSLMNLFGECIIL